MIAKAERRNQPAPAEPEAAAPVVETSPAAESARPAAPAEDPPWQPPPVEPARKTLADWAKECNWAHWEIAAAAADQPVNQLHTAEEAEARRQMVRNIPIRARKKG